MEVARGSSRSKLNAQDCTGQQFVEVATRLHATNDEARRMWQRLVNAVHDARDGESAAMERGATFGQLSTVVDAGPDQFTDLKDGEWVIAATTVRALYEGVDPRPLIA